MCNPQWLTGGLGRRLQVVAVVVGCLEECLCWHTMQGRVSSCRIAGLLRPLGQCLVKCCCQLRGLRHTAGGGLCTRCEVIFFAMLQAVIGSEAYQDPCRHKF